MKQTFVAVAFLALAGTSWADDKQAKAALDRAIEAHGGAPALAKAVRSRRTEAGSLWVRDRQVAFVRKVVSDLPERRRQEITLDRAIESTQVLDGRKGYSNDRGVTTDLDQQRVDELREEAHVDWVATLVPLQKGKFALSSLGGSQLEGEQVVGVEAKCVDRPTVRLFFSAKTGLLLKMSWRGRAAGKDVDRERLFSGHKDFNGVKWPTKEVTTVAGKKHTEVTISGVEFPAKLDEKAFARP
jgi:hypothetical protein